MPTRRALINLAGFAGLGALAYGTTGLLRRLSEPALEFSPIRNLPGFRRIKGGPVSGGATMMVGLDRADASAPPKPGLGKAALCDVLFGPAPDKSRVQIAYFTDYRCLYCRKISPMLAELGTTVQITWHDLPLLGPISDRGARAAVAAAYQGAYATFHTRLMGTPVMPTPGYLRQLAQDAGIDGDRLLRDMTSARTEKQLAQTAAAARLFGFVGTPALVVGRTAALGGIDQRLLDRLIATERAEISAAVC